MNRWAIVSHPLTRTEAKEPSEQSPLASTVTSQLCGYPGLKPTNHKRLPFRHKTCLTRESLAYKFPCQYQVFQAVIVREEPMNSTATWEFAEPTALAQTDEANNSSERGGSSDTGDSPERGDSSSSKSGINTLKELALQLLCELQCIDEISALSVESGLDFYDEVRRFEIDLIKRALLQTGGHQVRAAKLLNLKVTTLNSKIKHYNIGLTGFTNVYPLVDAGKIVEHQHA
jgi:DNA-binding protein Fis